SIDGKHGIRAWIRTVRRTASMRDRALLDEWAARFAGDAADYPTPAEVVHLRGDDDPQLGRRIMTRAQWYGVKRLRDCDTAVQPEQFGQPREALPGTDCVQALVDDELNVHGREMRIVEGRNSMQTVALTAGGRLRHVAIGRQMPVAVRAMIAKLWA